MTMDCVYDVSDGALDVAVSLHVGDASAVPATRTNISGLLPCGNRSWNDSDGRIEMVLEPHSMAHLLATSIILGTGILATIIGNVFVLAAVILERNLHNVANYLIASLAVADLMVAALVMPLAAVNEVSTQWFLGTEICDMWISFDVLCCTSSILHLVAIAMDRYWAVTRVDYIHNRSAGRILMMIALSWGISACISIPPLFGWKDSNNNPDVTGECLISQDWGYTVYSTVGAFYLPLCVLIIIYVKIFGAAKNRIRKKRFKMAASSTTDPAAPKPLLERNNHTNHFQPSDGGSMLQATVSSVSQSPDASSNGSTTGVNDANRNTKTVALTPPASPIILDRSPSHKSSWVDLTKMYVDGKKNNSPRAKKTREKIEQKRERKAARTLAIITGSFITCWLPFFIMALLRPFCGNNCYIPTILFSIIGWLGYFNSLLNPIIYTIFNPDFRCAFRKILFGKYHNRYNGRTRHGARR